MYSLILMTAVASTGDSSSFNWRRGGCTGCYGAAPVTYVMGCYGTASYVMGGYASCSGYGGCGGCWGSNFYPTTSFGCAGSSCFGSGCFGSVSGLIVTSPILDGCSAALPTSTISETKPAAANIKIELPADSQLYVDGQLVPGTGTTRSFSTPKLTAGRSFVYEMSAEVVVGGAAVREDLKLIVHAGDDVQKSFGKLIAATTHTKPTELAKK